MKVKQNLGCNCEMDSRDPYCNDCVDQESIFFSGICEPSKFDLTNFWTEQSIVGTVSVPKVKPSIEELDSITTKVEIISKKVIITPVDPAYGTVTNEEGKKATGRKLLVEGLVCLAISYVSLKANQSVHSFHGQIPFSAFIVLPPGTCLEYDYRVDACIEEVCVKRVCDRTIDFTVTLVLTATRTMKDCSKTFYNDSGINCSSPTHFSECCQKECFTDQPVIKGICPVEKINGLLVDRSTRWTEISVPELLTIPCAKPDVAQILSVTSKIEVMCQKIIATPEAVSNYEGLKLTGYKLMVHALLRQRITYVSTEDCKSVHSAHYDVPISAYIVLPKGTTKFIDKFKIIPCIEDIFACPLNERQIFKNTTLFIKAEPIECSENI